MISRPSEVPDFSGFLKRKGAFFGMWNQCWCEVHKQEFFIFKNKSSDSVERKISINPETRTKVIPGSGFKFSIQNPDEQSYVFGCENEDSQMEWLLALKSATIKDTTTTMDSFNIISVLGRGFYGKVMLVQKKGTNQLFAIKTMHKNRLLKSRKVHTVFCERNIMMKVKHPFIVSLSFAFQSPAKFYLGMEYIPGGELFRYVQQKGTLPIEEVRFYIAEIGLALEHLHSLGVIYRDLKPENVLLDEEGHVKLTDFGLSKEITETNSTTTFCGTAEYLAPEVIRREEYSYPIDWWALGCLAYELCFGMTPFFDENKSRIFQKVLTEDPYYDDDADPFVVDFINKLLDKDPKNRATFDKLKKHPFWENFDFEACLEKRIKPEYVPLIENKANPENFDSEFTHETPADSIATPADTQNTAFAGFSFAGNLDGEDQSGLPPIPSFML